MADVDVVLGALLRIELACRSRAQSISDTGVSVTERQARVLRCLDGEDPAMVTELAEFVGVTPATMSLSLQRLEREGLVHRSRDPEDRRVVNVRLTELGDLVRESLRPLDPERVAATLGLLSEERRYEALRGLTLLAEACDTLLSRRAVTSVR